MRMKPVIHQRRRFRPILTLSLALVALLSIWVGVEVYFAYTARPNPTVDYGLMLEGYSNLQQPEGKDGWPVLIGLIELHNEYIQWDGYGSDPIRNPRPGEYRILSMYDGTKSRLLAKDQHDENGGSKAQLVSLEAQYQKALSQIAGWDRAGITERLIELAACDRLIRPLGGSGELLLNATTGETSHFLRPLCVAIHERMKQGRQVGDWDRYVESFEIGMGIGRLLCHQPFSVEYMSGVYARSLFLKQSISDIESGSMPPEVRDSIQAAFDRQRLRMKTSHVIEAELLTFLDIAQRVYDQRGRLILTELDRYPIGHELRSELPIANIQSLWMPRRNWVNTEMQELYKAESVHVDLPLFARSGSQLTDYERLDTERVLNRDLDIWSGVIGPPVQLTGSSDTLALIELAFVAVTQLHRYRDDNGEYPRTLDQLVPTYLDELPIDPCSDSGEALVYKLLDEPDEFGRRYILYSRGRDLEDNGGKVPLDEHPEAPLTRRSLDGYDYVLNHPRSLATH